MGIKSLIKELAFWEFIRIKFNAVMLVSGILLYFIINFSMPLKTYGWSHGKGISEYYSETIFGYGILANILFTLIYIYAIILKNKLNLSEKNIEFDAISKRLIINGGLALNILTGIIEVLYRYNLN